ncbi:MAG: hypothetical protein AAF434_17325 [Pseudomonadota bacterium]
MQLKSIVQSIGLILALFLVTVVLLPGCAAPTQQAVVEPEEVNAEPNAWTLFIGGKPAYCDKPMKYCGFLGSSSVYQCPGVDRFEDFDPQLCFEVYSKNEGQAI